MQFIFFVWIHWKLLWNMLLCNDIGIETHSMKLDRPLNEAKRAARKKNKSSTFNTLDFSFFFDQMDTHTIGVQWTRYAKHCLANERIITINNKTTKTWWNKEMKEKIIIIIMISKNLFLSLSFSLPFCVFERINQMQYYIRFKWFWYMLEVRKKNYWIYECACVTLISISIVLCRQLSI